MTGRQSAGKSSWPLRDYTPSIRFILSDLYIMKLLESWWIAGFVDGEWCFYVWINAHPEMTTWFQILPEFRIVQHYRDIQLLHKIKSFFNCGVIRVNHGDRYELRIRSIEHLSTIIVPFFKKYSLQTKKKHDFIKFAKIITLIEQWKHLTDEWVNSIRDIASSMNTWSDKDIVHTITKSID